jgi:hypothetical protein
MVELRRLVVQIGAVMGREVAVVLLDTGFQKRLMQQVGNGEVVIFAP